jgi:hypothetical protein
MGPGARCADRVLPPLHDAAAVGADGAGRSHGRQADVRPPHLRPSILRSPSRTRGRGVRPRHLCRGDVLRRMGAASESRPRPRRGPSAPRRQQRERDRDRLDRRLPGPAARPAGPGAPGVLHPEARRHRPRPAQRPVGGRERVLGRREGRRCLRGGLGTGGHARVGRLDGVAVLGDRRREAPRGGAWLRDAPDRDDDAVPRPGADEGQRPTVLEPSRLDLTRVRRRDLRGRRERPIRSP